MIQEVFLTSDVADAMVAAGCTMRTPAAVRSAVDQGRLNPDLQTPRGVRGWSREALLRDVEATWRRQRMRGSLGPVRPQKQLEIGG